MTVMDKLHKKGWLQREMVGRAYVYKPVASRESYTARLMRESLANSENQAAAFVHSYLICPRRSPRRSARR